MPSTATDRLNGLTTSVAVKAPCRVGTTANITLSGLQTIDGVALSTRDRVLVKDQTNAVENGIYVASSSDWVRAQDFDGSLDVVGGTWVKTNEGTDNGNSYWEVDGNGRLMPGTDEIEFNATSGNLTLAADLASPDPGKGAALIAYRDPAENSYAWNLFDRTRYGDLHLFDFIPPAMHTAIELRTSNTDVSGYIQNAIDACRDETRKLVAPPGLFKCTLPLYYHNLNTDHEFAPGFMFEGAGMGRTIFDCSDWEDEEESTFLTVANHPDIANQIVFLKGSVIADFTARGKPTLLHNGIKLQCTWYTLLARLRINNFGKNGGANMFGGNGLVIGSETGQTSPDSNPDWTAALKTTILGCEIDWNATGVFSPANNNAPEQNYLESSIRNNARGGIHVNSSYIIIGAGSTVASNGLYDVSGPSSDPKANCFGGFKVAQVDSSTYSNNYRSKGIQFMGELDTNYPCNIDFKRTEGAIIDGTSVSFGDYYFTTAEWAAMGIYYLPDAQILLGGGDSADKAHGTEIRGGTRPSWVLSSGNLALRSGGSSWLRADQFQLGGSLRETTVNFDLTGTAKAVGYVTFQGQPLDGDTITVNGKVYTFRTTLTAADGDVQLGADFETTVSNFIKAVSPSARATITLAGVPAAGETITIEGQTYTFRAAASVAYEITLGASAAATATNIANAVMATSTGWGAGTIAHPYVTALADRGYVYLLAKVAGTTGNAYSLSTSIDPDDGTLTVSGVLFSGGVGVKGINYSIGMTPHATVWAWAGAQGIYVLLQAKVAGTGGNAFTLTESASFVTVSGATFSGGGSATIGTDMFMLTEATKTGDAAAFNISRHYMSYEIPRANWPGPSINQSAFDTPFKRVSAPDRAPTRFSYFLTDDEIMPAVPVPSRWSESPAPYGVMHVSGGTAATSASLFYRASASPDCGLVGSGATSAAGGTIGSAIEVKNIVLDDLADVTDGKLGISAFSDGKIYAINRTGAQMTLKITFDLETGTTDQTL